MNEQQHRRAPSRCGGVTCFLGQTSRPKPGLIIQCVRLHGQHDLGDSKHPDLVLTTPLTGSCMRSGCRRAVALTFTAKNASEPVTPSTLKLSRVPQHSQCWGRERFPLPGQVSSLVGLEQGEPGDQHGFPGLGR